jgi:ATP-dependent exoDNAse (exonuclease V) beta subunit
MEPPSYLKEKNPHPRDERILFDEPTHVYTIDGDSNFTSVTTFNHKLFEAFDADKIIAKMKRSKNWKLGHRYFGKTDEEIKALWEKNRDEAAQAGTKMHYDIECYYNECPNENDSVEYKYFKNFTEAFPELKPYRTEWTVFHEELKLAGSIDMVFQNENDDLLIYDWKRSREIVRTNNWNKCSNIEIISHIPDTNYWHYCLQLNTYKAILEAKYDKKVVGLYLVCLHPENKNNNFQRIKVVDLQEEVNDLFNFRLNELKIK